MAARQRFYRKGDYLVRLWQYLGIFGSDPNINFQGRERLEEFGMAYFLRLGFSS